MSQQTQKKFPKWTIWVMSIIAILIVITLIQKMQSPPTIPSEEPEYRYLTNEGTLERTVEQITIDAFGKTANWEGKPKKVIEISKDLLQSGPDKGGYIVVIRYRADEAMGDYKRGVIMGAKDFTKDLYGNPACSRINKFMLLPHLMGIDKYGNEREFQVGGVALRRAVAQKINWQNMNTDLFRQLLEREGEIAFRSL